MPSQSSNARVAIKPPALETIAIGLRGTEQLCINKFSAKAMAAMKATQEAGSTAKSKKVREAKDFDAVGNAARHISTEGWDGIHAGAFRNAAISACRTVGFTMTKAKLAIFIKADGYDVDDGTPLIRIYSPNPKIITSPCRNASGVVDLRPRPHYFDWGCVLRVQYDSDMFTLEDVTNLFMRVGMQVGIGEGRPDSKSSAGLGYGLFEIVSPEEITNG
jgi:hypothetical protein